MAEAAAEIGRVFKGKYRIEGKLGAGAFGTVYAAVQLGLDKPVAVKLLAPEAFKTPGASERFEREALLASKISHPVMAQILDFGVDEGTPFLVMELVEGDDLSAVLAESGALKPARAVAIMRQLASLLSEVHACGIVHRDLKPANMKLLRYSKTARQVHVKVLDFGIAKDIGSEAVQRLTATGSFVGTPRYMSPEQVRGGAVDARSDLYSCGVIFYELLTGDAPFRAGSVIELIARVLNDPPPVLPTRFPEAVRQTVARLLDKDPAVRFDDAHALDAALEECELACRGMDFAETQRSGEHGGDALAETLHSGGSASGPVPRPPTGQGRASLVASPAPPAAVSAAPAAPAPAEPPVRRRVQLMFVVTVIACAAAVAAIFIALRRPKLPGAPPAATGPNAGHPAALADAGLAAAHADDAAVTAVAAPSTRPSDGGAGAVVAARPAVPHPPPRPGAPVPPARPASGNSLPECKVAIDRADRFLGNAAFGRARSAALSFLASAEAVAGNCPLQRLQARAIECKALCQNGKGPAYVSCLHNLQQEGHATGSRFESSEITLEVQQVCGAYFKP